LWLREESSPAPGTIRWIRSIRRIGAEPLNLDASPDLAAAVYQACHVESFVMQLTRSVVDFTVQDAIDCLSERVARSVHADEVEAFPMTCLLTIRIANPLLESCLKNGGCSMTRARMRLG
jgi:hypothetical protein